MIFFSFYRSRLSYKKIESMNQMNNHIHRYKNDSRFFQALRVVYTHWRKDEIYSQRRLEAVKHLEHFFSLVFCNHDVKLFPSIWRHEWFLLWTSLFSWIKDPFVIRFFLLQKWSESYLFLLSPKQLFLETRNMKKTISDWDEDALDNFCFQSSFFYQSFSKDDLCLFWKQRLQQLFFTKTLYAYHLPLPNKNQKFLFSSSFEELDHLSESSFLQLRALLDG